MVSWVKQPGSDRGLFGDTSQSTAEVEYAPPCNLAIRLQYSSGRVFDNRFEIFQVNAKARLASGIE